MKRNWFTKKKALCLAGLAAGALLLFVCCDGMPGDETSEKEQSASADEGALISEYILVRGDSSGNEVLRQVLELKGAIDERFGTNTRSSTDWAVDVEGADGRVKEILVGETNREESIAVNAELEGVNGYVIRTVGDKIVITASTTGLLKEAVALFTKDYIEKSTDGSLPEAINVSRKTGLPLGVMSDEGCLSITLSSRATQALRHAVNDFADRIFELSGVRPLVEFVGSVQNGEIVFRFEDHLFTEPESTLQSRPGASGGQVWQMTREGNRITLKAEADLQLIAGIARLYEILVERADRTLDGKTVFFYDGASTMKDSWQSDLPRLIGGGYMGSENVASNSVSHYYEDVSLNALCAWKMLIQQEDELGEFVTVIDTGDRTQFVLEQKDLQIYVYYNGENDTLEIIEQTSL